MLNFIVNCIIWVLAIYGFIDIVKNLIYINACNKVKTNGIHVIVAVKNEENNIEGFLRSFNFKMIYNSENLIDNIILLDLNSIDSTKHILEKYAIEHSNYTLINWDEFNEIFNPITYNNLEKNTKKFN